MNQMAISHSYALKATLHKICNGQHQRDTEMDININRVAVASCHRVIWLLFLLAPMGSLEAQDYVAKQTRHRFAQSTFGIDYFGNSGVSTSYLDSDGLSQPLTTASMFTPRLIIGGTHFWGHADFAVAFPLKINEFDTQNQTVNFGSTVETSFKYFPWRIQNNRFAPYVGAGFTGYFYQQKDNSKNLGQGPELSKAVFPLMAGVTFNHKNHLLEAGVSYINNNQSEYYLSESQKSKINVEPTFFNFSYRYMLDTTLSSEKAWESGKTKKLTDKYANEGKLNNLFLSAGPSAAFQMGENSYNTAQRPFLSDAVPSTFADLGMGYHLHSPDVMFTLNYRAYNATNNAYSVEQSMRRQSIGLEVTKTLADYNGFVPYVGPIVSLEKLSFTEKYNDEITHDIDTSKLALGLTFGWDILPNRLQTWVLRTNLRWYPELDVDVDGEQKISFDTLEFNFIQAVYYPGRRKMER